MDAKQISDVFRQIGEAAHENKRLHNWFIADSESWNQDKDIPTEIALIHEEVSEALMAFRRRDFNNFSEELGDIIARVVGLGHGMGVDFGAEICNKIEKIRNKAKNKDKRI